MGAMEEPQGLALDPSWLETRLEAGPVRLSRLHTELAFDIGLNGEWSERPSYSEVRWTLNGMAQAGEVALTLVAGERPDILITPGAHTGPRVSLTELLAGFPPNWPEAAADEPPPELNVRNWYPDVEGDETNEVLRQLGF